MDGGADVIVHSFPLDPNSSQCGYPICCPGQQPKFVQPVYPSEQLQQCRLDKELAMFFSQSEEIFHETGMPMFPFICHHFCLPFSPVCAALYCASQRREKLNDLVDEFNKESTKKGLYLAFNSDFINSASGVGRGGGDRGMVAVMRPAVDLKMNRQKREKYCKSHGIPFAAPAGPSTSGVIDNASAMAWGGTAGPVGGGFSGGGAMAMGHPMHHHPHQPHYDSHHHGMIHEDVHDFSGGSGGFGGGGGGGGTDFGGGGGGMGDAGGGGGGTGMD